MSGYLFDRGGDRNVQDRSGLIRIVKGNNAALQLITMPDEKALPRQIGPSGNDWIGSHTHYAKICGAFQTYLGGGGMKVARGL